MPRDTEFSDAYECIAPELGDQIWRLGQADTRAELRTNLEHHVTACDSCRLTLAVESAVQTGAREQTVIIPSVTNQPVSRRWNDRSPLSLAGGLALAASLTLALLLPPGQLKSTLVRGEVPMGFVRPVEGEVLLQETPELSWTPIPAATAYNILITGVDDEYQWSGRSEGAKVTVPEEFALPKGKRVRAVVQPVPSDLAPLGAVSVTFRRENPGRFLSYRLAAAPLPVKLLGWVGGLVLLMATTRRHWGKIMSV